MGAATCQGCHQPEWDHWMGSHHQLAMAEAKPSTVLANFVDAQFSINGVTTEFEQIESGASTQYFVITENAQGDMQRFEITHTFGWDPLQQYMVSFEDGRKQVLNIAWDTRPADQGGQRWFHLYPDDPPEPGSPLHWTGFTHNWNTSCAGCHSTNLEKNYDLATNSFDTSFTDINVACESCHGPASDHLIWSATQDQSIANAGFVIDFAATGDWIYQEAGQAIATRINASGIPAEQEVCAQCHALRTELLPFHAMVQESGTALGAFHDAFMLSPVSEPQYHIDGQIHEEVFVAGSFWQSRMHDMGVTCSNCHNPHSLELILPGNSLCAQCHSPAVYDQPEHSFHIPGSTGALCVECHMPAQNFMVVDPRRDHSIRIPRPDLSLTQGTPNACNQCHTDQSVEWAAAAFNAWWPNPGAHYSELIQANRQAEPNSINWLYSMLTQLNSNAIADARILEQIGQSNDPNAQAALRRATRAESPLERQAAIRALQQYPPDQRLLGNLVALLDDDALSVRYLATMAIAEDPNRMLSASQNAVFEHELQRTAEILNSQMDVPGMALQMANLQNNLGNLDAAEQAARQALAIAPGWTPAQLNLAQILVDQGDETAAQALLQQAVVDEPLSADAHYALALSQIRSQQMPAALASLAKAFELAPNNSHYGYVYGVALAENNQIEQAIATLQQVLTGAPNAIYIGTGLASYQIQAGQLDGARQTTALLLQRAPNDPQVQNLVSYLSRLP